MIDETDARDDLVRRLKAQLAGMESQIASADGETQRERADLIAMYRQVMTVISTIRTLIEAGNRDVALTIFRDELRRIERQASQVTDPLIAASEAEIARLEAAQSDQAAFTVTLIEVTAALGLLIGTAFAVLFMRRAVVVPIEQVTAAKEVVERAVQERTRELEDALTNLQAAQDELIRAEKLAALGGIVAAVAHEIATPIGSSLTVVSTLDGKVRRFVEMVNSDSLRRSAIVSFTVDLQDATRLITHSLTRAAEMIDRFKRVAVDQASDRRRPFDLRTVTWETLETLRPSFRNADVTFEDSMPDGIRIDGYPGAWSQIVSNLVSNAVLHGFGNRQGGRIRIAANPPSDGLVEVRIADDGIGMEPQVQRRVFEPFFTTRLSSGGSGLGLHIVYSIVVKVLGGRIRLESTPGLGTTFIIAFPLNAPERPGPSVEETAS